MTSAQQLTKEQIDDWIKDENDTVALILKQRLVPIDGEGGIIFPPTYADIGYCIDEISDGTKVAQVDSVGSQANRMEPIFMESPYRDLVPQIRFSLGKDENDEVRYVSLLELAHRAGDAVVRSSVLAEDVDKAFRDLLRKNDAAPLAKIAPTSLVFGAWDSRGTGVKRPRLVRSIIRAEDVDVLHSAAQFNSVWKSLDEEQRKELEKEAKKQKVKLSVKGFHDAPAVFRTDKVKKFKDDKLNIEARVLGGVVARGPIYRQTTVNLIALRSLHTSDDKTEDLRCYLLGLSLVAATNDMDMYLREGCFLRYTEENEESWEAVKRRGKSDFYNLSSDKTQKIIFDYTKSAKDKFGIQKNVKDSYEFSIKKARKLLAKEDDTMESET